MWAVKGYCHFVPYGSYSASVSLSRITGCPDWVLEKSDSTFHWEPPVNSLLASHLSRCFYKEHHGMVFEYFSSGSLGKEDCFLRYYNWFLNSLYFLWVIRPGCAVVHHGSLKICFLLSSHSYSFLWHGPEIAYNYYLFTIIWTPTLSFSYKHDFL